MPTINPDRQKVMVLAVTRRKFQLEQRGCGQCRSLDNGRSAITGGRRPE